ncbi:MerC domain-containing protein [Sphingomonas sp. VNH70]|uniref:MerC domain-containing protein n=1 Tax=Sphingomonas silueang TaxID=3156617 RepID=UPI0032B3AD74
MITMRHAKFLDGAAIGASLLCLIHCIGLPILFALLPALATIGGASTEWLHVVLLLTAVPLSGTALIGGYRAHGRVVPLVLGVVGLAALAAGVTLASAPAAETALTVAGSLALAGAHVGNWRRLRPA